MLQCSLPANIRRANHLAVSLWLTAGAPPATRGSRVKWRQCRFTVNTQKDARNVHKCATIHIVYRIANPIYNNSRTITTQITYCTDCMLLLRIATIVRCNVADIHSSPKVMAVFLFLIFENFLIGGMFSILETIKTDRSTLILQNKNWCQMINPMCTTFQMWQNCILQNQVCFERLISLSKTPYIFVKISKPRNWDPCSISAISHGNRTSSYETVAHKLRPSVAFDWQLWPFPQT